MHAKDDIRLSDGESEIGSFQREKKGDDLMSWLGYRLKSELRRLYHMIKRIPLIIYLITMVILLFILIERYVFGWTAWPDWTGFGPYTGSIPKDDRGKTLWDLLGLLIIPVALSMAAYLFNKSERASELKIAEKNRTNDLEIAQEQRKTDLRIAENRDQEATLQNYLDKITDLILNQKLRGKKKKILESLAENEQEGLGLEEHDPVFDIAQVRTITALRQLNTDHQNILLQFLRDAALADFILISASLADADLSGTRLYNFNLSKASFTGTNLKMADLSDTLLCGANLVQCDLNGAKLIEADLSGASLLRSNLSKADLSNAILNNSNLRKANLVEANLSAASLCGTVLWEANLSKATMTESDLSQANLLGANLTKANLSRANLSETNLFSADLSEAILEGSIISEEQYLQAKSLKGTIMPDGNTHT